MTELNALLEKLFPDKANKVIEAVNSSIGQKVEGGSASDWYEKLNLYVTYPDSFHDGDTADLRVLRHQLKEIQELGFNCVHILPFLASPMVDMGFDLSDYFLVREELGGGKALDKFLREAQSLDMKVMMDVVLNHVSEEHRWYRQAVSGDEFYRDFFLWQAQKPTLLETYTNDTGYWARYQIQAEEVDIRIIFPEQSGELPHWVQAEDDYWYYHTFYPHQLDLNWYNHHVFVTFAKILIYWAKKGMLFRLDAVPFVSKQLKSGLIESNPRVHDLVKALHLIVKHVNPDCLFLVEANQPPEVVKQYFGSDQQVETELAYNFSLMTALWTTLLSEDANHLWECVAEQLQNHIPDHAHWVTFLRNHDELTLEYASPEQRQLILRRLKGRGKPFREGFGYAGRIYNFLENDARHVLMAYFLLASLPGSPAVIFGDELAKEYSNTFMKLQTRWKRRRFADPDIAHDTRDINRSPVFLGEDELTEDAIFLKTELGKVFTNRSQFTFSFKNLAKIDSVTDTSIVAGRYNLPQPLEIYINLSDDLKEIPVSGELILGINQARLKTNRLELPAYAGGWVKPV